MLAWWQVQKEVGYLGSISSLAVLKVLVSLEQSCLKMFSEVFTWRSKKVRRILISSRSLSRKAC